MIFLDTNIISYYFKANATVKDKMLEAIDRNEHICTTAINAYEIFKGLKRKGSKRKENQFSAFLKDVAVFTIDDGVTDITADIYSD